MEREDMYEGPYVSLSELAYKPWEISQAEAAFIQWAFANGKGKCKFDIGSHNVEIVQ